MTTPLIDQVHPDLKDFYANKPLWPSDPTADIAADRAAYAELKKQQKLDTELSTHKDVSYIERLVPGPEAGAEGSTEVRVGVLKPVDAPSPMPALMWLHGGAKALGHISTVDIDYHRSIATAVGCMVVSVEYRLAPEDPFPAGLEDCYAALKWLFTQADELGVDPSRIAIGGASGGGGLAAELALLTRDRGEVSVMFQFLNCPMIDDRITESSRYASQDKRVWNAERLSNYWEHYLGEHGKDGNFSPYAVAARAEDLNGLPSAYIAVGALDGFLDESLEYARRLIQSGVSVETHIFPGAPHAFEYALMEANISRHAHDLHHQILKRAFYP